jgi:two-component system sensor kinase FixL
VDAVQIEQVIINLLLNAIEAMRQSGIAHPTLTLQTAVQNGAVAVSVEDNGPGIDPAVVDQIFDPFFTTKQRGMGMGLSICRSIIEQHGGRLWADRAASGGAVFRLLLPTSEGVANHGQ